MVGFWWGLRWLKKVLVAILGPRAILKLQTARFRTPEELQTRDLDQKLRLDELYLAMGGLGGQKLKLNPKMSKKLIFLKIRKFAYTVPWDNVGTCYPSQPKQQVAATLPKQQVSPTIIRPVWLRPTDRRPPTDRPTDRSTDRPTDRPPKTTLGWF